MEDSDLNLLEQDLPHSIEAEQCVLGAILADPSVISIVVDNIKTEYFFSSNHRSIYSVIIRMFMGGKSADTITVLNEIEKLNLFETSAECRRYLMNISEMLPSSANVESYCKIVADKYYMRSLGIVAKTILHEVQAGSYEAQELIDLAEQKIYDIREGKNVQGLVPLADALDEAYEHIGRLAGPDREKYLGARTGFSGLDAMTSGLNKSELIIIAARPGMGKTAFAMNIASHVARHSDKEVVVFNLEMSKEQLATRLISTEAKIDSKSLRTGRISNDDWLKIATSTGRLSTLPILIDDTASMTVPRIKAKLRRTKNLGLVVIDYLQLMESTSKSDNRVTVVSEITRQLKIMAKELNVPVILLSQLSRSTEGRTDKRPQLADLRDSGSIEQDADVVLFLYREAYYNKESPNKNISECIVAKNRSGELGTVEMYWDGKYTRFADLNRTAE